MHERRARRQRRLEIDDGVDRIDVDDRRRRARLRRRSGSRPRPSRSARRRSGPCPSPAAAACRRETRGPESAAVARAAGPACSSRRDRPRCRPRRRPAALARGRDVDALQRAVRDDAAHERDVQHPRQLHIVHEHRAAGEQARVFVAADAAAERRRSPSDVRTSDSAFAGTRACPRRSAPRARCAGSRCSGRDSPRSRRESPARSGVGLSRRNAVSVISMPGVQKPHCRPCASSKRGLQRIQLAVRRRPGSRRSGSRGRRPAPRA